MLKDPSIPPRLILDDNHLILITKKGQALIK